jgi:biopolymer transport protein ExbB/TolQ
MYNFNMARGWESKSVEQQIEDARRDTNRSPSANAAPAEVERRRRREGLLLQRSRILQEIDSARNPRYQELLKEMLRHLEIQLSSQ